MAAADNNESRDRRAKLLDSAATMNGIDYVEISSENQLSLRVHFLNAVEVKADVSEATITGGDVIRRVTVNPIKESDWQLASDHRTLDLTVKAPGDFSFYTLKLTYRPDSLLIDPFFDHVTFSFKALCPSDLDCASPPTACPSPSGDRPPIDYLAKDFLSFRKALSDFSALRYPQWVERAEADFGVMFMEALCSLADDLSYLQDRIAAEAALDTATQRRSIVRHARLVDYEPRPATAARVLLQLDVTSNSLPAGLLVSAQQPDGSLIDFETGAGLADKTNYSANPRWNRGIQPYYWDDSRRCLKAGATEMWIKDHGFNFKEHIEKYLNDPLNAPPLRLLLDTPGATSADPPIREIVQLIDADEQTDWLFNEQVTHIVWRPEDALKADHDLTRTVLAGNLIPATQGRRYTEHFSIPPDEPPSIPVSTPLALCRTGPNQTSTYLYTLRNTSLAWLAQDDTDALPEPEIALTNLEAGEEAGPWRWRRSLLKADRFESAFTVEPGRYTRIARLSAGSIMEDYDGDAGDTLRFGDGVFGELPNSGALFAVGYRVGGGAAGNVAADSITRIDPAWQPFVTAVTNPFAATGGADEEADERVRRLAPQAFRARQFRAVRPEDYRAAAEILPWVQRAGTVFRWTGSWLTVFTTPDPKESEELPLSEHKQLVDLLNRYRLAGYESYVLAPRYVALDLKITVCARPDVFQGDVKEALLAALGNSRLSDGTTGFFHPDRFTFGTPLERSALEAAIQAVYGVAGVLLIQYRPRGLIIRYRNMPDTITVASDQIIQLDNNPSRPERGSLKVSVRGGK